MTEKYKFIDKNSEVDEDGEHVDLGVHEASRITGSNSYDDNWDLVNYTSELRDDKNRFYAFVDFHVEEGEIKLCPHCLEYGFQNKLQPRILKKGEAKPPDYDLWAQCYECGEISELYKAVQEPEIKDSEETIDNPFENESVFMSSKKRKYKNRRLNSMLDDDPDIAAEQKRHGSNKVHIIQ